MFSEGGKHIQRFQRGILPHVPSYMSFCELSAVGWHMMVENQIR